MEVIKPGINVDVELKVVTLGSEIKKIYSLLSNIPMEYAKGAAFVKYVVFGPIVAQLLIGGKILFYSGTGDFTIVPSSNEFTFILFSSKFYHCKIALLALKELYSLNITDTDYKLIRISDKKVFMRLEKGVIKYAC